jgi:oxygen-independent coproporphyrinogen-3 oxidase
MDMLAQASAHAEANGLEPYYLYRQKNILANLENIGYARSGCGCRYNVETMSERQTILAAGSGGITKISHDGRRMERAFNVRELSQYIGRIDDMIEKKRELLQRHFP